MRVVGNLYQIVPLAVAAEGVGLAGLLEWAAGSFIWQITMVCPEARENTGALSIDGKSPGVARRHHLCFAPSSGLIPTFGTLDFLQR